MNKDAIRETVREAYGALAEQGQCGTGGCCVVATPDASAKLGYSPAEMGAVPEGANLGLGCGNPGAIANLREGDTVLDLGSGAGFDAFLAGQRVGASGSVIGVDMTAAMIAKARANANRANVTNVTFRLGEIEQLPIANETVDVVISNCVINLSPDKAAVFKEAHRVLKAGGRLAISDVVGIAPIPQALREQAAAIAGCVGNVSSVEEIELWLREAGFTEVRVTVKSESRDFIRDWMPGSGAENFAASATIEAVKASSGATAKNCCAPSCCQ